MRIRSVLGIAITGLLLVACGSGSEDRSLPITSDSSGPFQASEVSPAVELSLDGVSPGDVIGCRNGPFFPAEALTSVIPLVEAARPEIEQAIAPFLVGEEGAFWPQAEAWSILHDTPDSVLLVATDSERDDEIQVGFMTVEQTDGVWQWAGSSLGESCPLHFPAPEDLGDVEWRLDPDQPSPTASSTQIHVLAHERSCAGGRSMEDRVVGPDVRETDDAVMISFAVEPLPGDQECPGNPEIAFTIDLNHPLGDRTVIDSRDLGVTLEDLLAG